MSFEQIRCPAGASLPISNPFGTVAIVAGEPSGDLHASQVAATLKTRRPDIDLFGMGGDLMEAAGVELVYHIRDSAVMGIAEVLTAIPTFLKKQRHLKQLIHEKRPNALLLIDFAEFNMGLAKFAHRLQIPVIYYIPPKAWAWRPGRAKKIARMTSAVASIFPFEAEFYTRMGAHVEFVGHPLLDIIDTKRNRTEARARLGLHEKSPVVGIMPGSRRKEVDRLLPVMQSVAHQIREVFSDCQFILPLAPNISVQHIGDLQPIRVVKQATYDAMRASDLMLIASGTATLEAACIGTPMVVLYKMSHLTWAIAKMLVKLDSSALPNIIAGRRIVPEYLQSDVQTAPITSTALDLLQNPEKRETQRQELRKVQERLGEPGAAERTARLVLDYMRK